MYKVKLVLCFLMVLGAKSQQTTKTILYNSSDLSYLSNGIQFPVPGLLEAGQADVNEKMPDLKWLTSLFDHHMWENRLSTIKNEHCSQDMKIYLENLINGTSWATKSQY